MLQASFQPNKKGYAICSAEYISGFKNKDETEIQVKVPVLFMYLQILGRVKVEFYPEFIEFCHHPPIKYSGHRFSSCRIIIALEKCDKAQNPGSKEPFTLSSREKNAIPPL
jgi:hypothetical protein